MVVEFIGCTGAGKSTLIKQVQSRLARTCEVTTSLDLIAGLLNIRNLTNPTVQNLVQEFVSFPFFLYSLSKYKQLILYTMRLFLRNSRVSIKTINNLRSLERKVGGYEITSRYSKDRIILVDEGPILAAHMFAFTGATYTPQEIVHFAHLLPLPDLVVYVRASVDTLVERTLRRGDPPREINKSNPAQTQAYAKSAIAIFEQLVQHDNIQQRLLMVESPDFAQQGYDEVVDHISESILDRRRVAAELSKPNLQNR